MTSSGVTVRYARPNWEISQRKLLGSERRASGPVLVSGFSIRWRLAWPSVA